MPGISRRSLTLAVKARLDTDTLTIWYVGEADGKVPTLDEAGHVKPYGCLYPSPGTPGDEVDLSDTTVDLDWLIQVTCAAAYIPDLAALVDRTHGLLYRWAPTIAGVVCGPLRPPAGFDPGPFPFDTSVSPRRPYAPLQYRLSATT